MTQLENEVSAALAALEEANKLPREIAGYSAQETAGKLSLAFLFVGERLRPAEKTSFIGALEHLGLTGKITPSYIDQPFHLLAGEVRPGSGIIRTNEGKPGGPAGTLSCWLASKDGSETYFLAAGHVLANYWKNDLVIGKSVYRNMKGYPSADTLLQMGTVVAASDRPKQQPPPGRTAQPSPPQPAKLDAGIVRLESPLDSRQRTTCFGSFGKFLTPKELKDRLTRKPAVKVTKCGGQEPHSTEAEIDQFPFTAYVEHPGGGPPFVFERQVLLKSAAPMPGPPTYDPTYFALPGDSGTLVVEQSTRSPLGMIFAGSAISGRYVMTPMDTLQDYWTRPGKFGEVADGFPDDHLVFLRG